ncbi:MAG: hypothetical protein HYV07_09385 [Deltaproteobacteria bacterium]|nr:hypothetical protein [Deltaproteobacteria bacterium]
MNDQNEPSDDVLAEIGARAHKLLSAIASNFDIAQALAPVGFDEEEADRGWALVDAVAGRTKVRRSSSENKAAQGAKAELDLWDEPNFEIIAAVLEQEFPDQAAFLFAGGLAPAAGWAAVQSVKTMLDRLDALESSPDREATREKDKEAIAKLAKRGYPASERERLATLVETARAGGADTRPGPTAEDVVGAERQAREARVRLWRWFNEWSRIAKKRITRRDYLIRMGLAQRRPSPASGEPA